MHFFFLFMENLLKKHPIHVKISFIEFFPLDFFLQKFYRKETQNESQLEEVDERGVKFKIGGGGSLKVGFADQRGCLT